MNKLQNVNGFFNGMNLNPIPLEFGQSVSTAKNLAVMLKMIDDIINFTNGWYDEILTDLEGRGALYSKLNEQFLTTFANDINTINTSLTNITTSITNLEYLKPTISINTSSQLINPIGTTLNSIVISSTYTGSNISKIEFYVNNSLYQTFNSPSNAPYIILNNITSDTTIKCKIYDNKNIVESNQLYIAFLNPFVYGTCANNSPTSTDIIGSEIYNSKINTEYFFNADSKNIYIAYPKWMGDLLLIKSANEENIINSFKKIEITLHGELYNVYVSYNQFIINNFKLIFEF